ncbi:hypothetical protein V8C43DRAFT_322894 [Trichoderma afarasin]
MDDQPPGSARPGDAQGQPRDDRPGLGRWLAQQPREDSVPFTFEWRETQETLTEETRSEGQAKDDDISVDCPHNVAGCQVTDEKNWSLANHIPLRHHENTKGDCDQPSSNAHDISQSEDVFIHQQQEHLRHVLFPSSGQEILELPFNQASMPSGPPETADYSGISYEAIQQNNDADQWLDTPDATCIHGMTDDRRRAFLQLYGEVQQELSTFDNASGSQQHFAPENSGFNSNLYPSHGHSVGGTSVTHTTESFSRLDTNRPRGCTPSHYPGLIPSHSSTNPSLFEPLRYACMTIPSYSSDTHSRAMDEVSSEMTFSTAPTTNISLYRNIGSYNPESTHVPHSNLANITKPASDSLETQDHGSEGPAHHSARRLRPGQYGTDGRKIKKRRICKANENEHDVHAYNCPFYLHNPSDYGEGNWELCAKSHWRTYQRMRLVYHHPPVSVSTIASTNSRREHLLRKHIRPAILCENCFEEFEDDDSLREHFESQCERKAHSPYLSTDQQSQLQTRIKGGMKEAEKMEQMYQIFSINGAFLSIERSRQIRFEMSLRSAIAASLIPPGDIERITNNTLQAIQRAKSTVGIEHDRKS